ncbi:hypothetical protein N9W34_01105 [Rickettsiales bacterium]|nr:hypothetical protein [Rickettsiales bacterium]
MSSQRNEYQLMLRMQALEEIKFCLEEQEQGQDCSDPEGLKEELRWVKDELDKIDQQEPSILTDYRSWQDESDILRVLGESSQQDESRNMSVEQAYEILLSEYGFVINEGLQYDEQQSPYDIKEARAGAFSGEVEGDEVEIMNLMHDGLFAGAVTGDDFLDKILSRSTSYEEDYNDKQEYDGEKEYQGFKDLAALASQSAKYLEDFGSKKEFKYPEDLAYSQDLEGYGGEKECQDTGQKKENGWCDILEARKAYSKASREVAEKIALEIINENSSNERGARGK